MPKARGPNYNLPKSRNKFTNDDDVALIKGILKYGVSWAKIYHDEEFPFANGIRDSTLSLRDRCRNRFPVVYKYLYDHNVDDHEKVTYLHHMRVTLTNANWNLEAHQDTSMYTTRSGSKMMSTQSNFGKRAAAPGAVTVKTDADEASRRSSQASSPKAAGTAAVAPGAGATDADGSAAMVEMGSTSYYGYPIEYYPQFAHEQLMGAPEGAEVAAAAAAGAEESQTGGHALQAMLGMNAPAEFHSADAAPAAKPDGEAAGTAVAAAVTVAGTLSVVSEATTQPTPLSTSPSAPEENAAPTAEPVAAEKAAELTVKTPVSMVDEAEMATPHGDGAATGITLARKKGGALAPAPEPEQRKRGRRPTATKKVEA